MKDSVSGDRTMVNGNHVAGTESIETSANEEGATFKKKHQQGDIMEVEASKIADKNARSTEVKDFVAKMFVRPTKSNSELKALVLKKKVIKPDALPAEDKIHLDAMKKMNGGSFDQHYMEMMITIHEKTIKLFRDGTESIDADIKNWAILAH